MGSSGSLPDGSPDRIDDRAVGGEGVALLGRDFAVFDPDREFAGIADHEIGGQAELAPEGIRRTGGMRFVVSALAVADRDLGHRDSFL